MSTVETRRCAALNTAGTRCKARPLRGTDLCGVHTPDHPVAARFGPGHDPTPGSGRPPKQRAIDIIREKIEADFEMVWTPMQGALTAERDGEADHAMRLRAAEALLDRAYGKPSQQVQHTGADGDAIRVEVSVPSDAERATAIAIALAQVKAS